MESDTTDRDAKVDAAPTSQVHAIRHSETLANKRRFAIGQRKRKLGEDINRLNGPQAMLVVMSEN
jgi:hypothetical protein